MSVSVHMLLPLRIRKEVAERPSEIKNTVKLESRNLLTRKEPRGHNY